MRFLLPSAGVAGGVSLSRCRRERRATQLELEPRRRPTSAGNVASSSPPAFGKSVAHVQLGSQSLHARTNRPVCGIVLVLTRADSGACSTSNHILKPTDSAVLLHPAIKVIGCPSG